jgi:hypothetical protein
MTNSNLVGCSTGRSAGLAPFRIAELAVKHRLPTVCAVREYAEAGCLIGYGPSLIDQYGRASRQR